MTYTSEEEKKKKKEEKKKEEVLRVIVLADPAHGPEGLGVLVGVGGVNVVQRLGVGGVSIAASEINTHREANLTASKDVLQERVDDMGLQ